MKRYEMIIAKHKASQLAKLDSAAAAIRASAARHGVSIGFHGSYAHGCTGATSDLDVIVLDKDSPPATERFLDEIDDIGVSLGVSIDVSNEMDAEHLTKGMIH